nr:immunoglobulin light chain junction region [Macaca mulatta]
DYYCLSFDSSRSVQLF